MKTYKYTDSSNTVVHVIDEDGVSRSSMLASELPEGTEILLADIPDPQIAINAEARAYLNSTDWMVQRHKDQLDLGIATSLTADEYIKLLQDRQAARDRIV